MKWLTKAAVLVIALAAAAQAAEVAILRNGFSIRHERREVIEGVTRLYLAANKSDYVDVPTEQIERFEKEEAPAAAAGAQVPAAAPAAALPEIVNTASDRQLIDADLINSVIRAESGFNAHAVSDKGAQGLMQLMPDTAFQLGVQDPFDPSQNVNGGTRYLRELLELYNNDLVKALAAYNAGPKRVEQYHGVPPYYATRAYVARVIRDFNRKKVAGKAAVAAHKTPKSATQAPPPSSAKTK